MKSIGVIVSSPMEAQAFGVKVYSWHPVQISEKIWLSCSGSTHHLEQSLQALLHLGVEGLLSWGFAGGLNPSLAAGTLIAPKQLVSATGPTLEVTPSWHRHLMLHLYDQCTVNCHTLAHSSTVIKNKTDKQNFYYRTQASSVDLESYPIGEFALKHELDFLVLRVILDDAMTELPDFIESLQDENGHLKPKNLVQALAHPYHWPSFIQLGHRYHKAQSHLKDFVFKHSNDLFSYFG